MGLLAKLGSKVARDALKTRISKASAEAWLHRQAKFLSRSRLRYLVQLPPYALAWALVEYHSQVVTGWVGSAWGPSLLYGVSVVAACLTIFLLHLPFAIVFDNNRNRANAAERVSAQLWRVAEECITQSGTPSYPAKSFQHLAQDLLNTSPPESDAFFVSPNAVHLQIPNHTLGDLVKQVSSALRSRLSDIASEAEGLRRALEGATAKVHLVLPHPTDQTVRNHFSRRAEVVKARTSALLHLNEAAVKWARSARESRDAEGTTVGLSRRLPGFRIVLGGNRCLLQQLPDDAPGILQPVYLIEHTTHRIAFEALRMGLRSLQCLCEEA